MQASSAQRSVLGLDVDPASSTNQFRAARFKQFWSIVESVLAEKGRCSVLDVGGTHQYWRTYGTALPASVSITLANVMHAYGPSELPNVQDVIADARSMPEFGDNQFDVVHSNSVIEHVGSWIDMAKMAKEVRRLAPRHFIQTPNYWFPYEPHARYPLFHYLPEPWKTELLMRKSRGFWPRATDIGHATEQCQSAILLSYHQMKFLFPESEIVREKFLWLTKSLVAVKR